MPPQRRRSRTFVLWSELVSVWPETIETDRAEAAETVATPPAALSGKGAREKRVKGIEPSPKAWEAFVLPLNYTRVVDGVN